MDTEKELHQANQTIAELREEMLRLENENNAIKRMLALHYEQLLGILEEEDIANNNLINELLFECIPPSNCVFYDVMWLFTFGINYLSYDKKG
ncbi:MAG: hypothetical protein Q8O88_00540 [bacterium]|nr:hypothetical protein [bacterium]